MSDPHQTVEQKMQDIFAGLVGERSRHLDGAVVSVAARAAITEALADHYGLPTAEKIAYHMADWNSEAAFIVAMHLFPERFTGQEIEAGIGMFLAHAPNHIRAACGLTGSYVWENFPDHDEGQVGPAVLAEFP